MAELRKVSPVLDAGIAAGSDLLGTALGGGFGLTAALLEQNPRLASLIIDEVRSDFSSPTTTPQGALVQEGLEQATAAITDPVEAAISAIADSSFESTGSPAVGARVKSLLSLVSAGSPFAKLMRTDTPTQAAEASYTALPPTLQTRIGQGLQAYLGGLRSIQPTDNPYGKALFDFFLSGAEDMAGEMARGNPYAVIDPRPRGPYINPQILDTLGILPVATAAKIPSEVIVPGLLASGAAAMGKIAKPTDGTPSLLEAMTPGMVDPRVGLLSQVGYHGTAAKFPPTEKNPLGEFDLQKIGTGEGAQAYGHGIYVAENPDVARDYRLRLSTGPTIFLDGRPVDSLTDEFGPVGLALDMGRIHDRKAALAFFDEFLKGSKQDREIVEQFDFERLRTELGSHLYEVDIPDEIIDNQMIDYDAPLSEQPEVIKQHLTELADFRIEQTASGKGWQIPHKGGWIADRFPGTYKSKEAAEKALNKYIQSELRVQDIIPQNAEESARLVESGIKGIKYKDQLSRGKEGGTRNFVLFDPSIATITGRN